MRVPECECDDALLLPTFLGNLSDGASPRTFSMMRKMTRQISYLASNIGVLAAGWRSYCLRAVGTTASSFQPFVLLL